MIASVGRVGGRIGGALEPGGESQASGSAVVVSKGWMKSDDVASQEAKKNHQVGISYLGIGDRRFLACQ